MLCVASTVPVVAAGSRIRNRPIVPDVCLYCGGGRGGAGFSESFIGVVYEGLGLN